MKKVAPGQSLQIPANDYNAFVDAAIAHQASRHGYKVDPAESFRQTGIVRIRNNSGTDLDRFGILGIDGPLITPTENQAEFENRPALIGSTPDADTHRGQFVVLAEPIPNGRIGRATINGFCPVRIAVYDEDHQYADINDTVAGSLASGNSGAAQILWKIAGTGTFFAFVRLGVPGCGIRRFELTETLGANGSAAANPVVWNGSMYASDTSTTITAYDALNIFTGDIGDRGYAISLPDRPVWEVIQLRC